MDSLSKMQFSVTHDIFYNDFIIWANEMKQFSCKDGIYILCTNKSINRALGTDSEGILYIGKGILTDLARPRIGTLVNSLNNTATYHEAGVRYHQIPQYKEKFPLEGLKLKVELFVDARNEEKNRLKNYLEEFGEYPPLNRCS